MNPPLAATRSYYSRVYAYATAHKVIAAVVTVVVLFVGYKAYGAVFPAATETTYVTAEAATSTIVSAVSGSGQVAATTQVDLKPQGSGTIVYVGVKQGQTVSKGTLLVKLDSTTADKAVRDAQANLTAAEISYQQSIASAGGNAETARSNGFDAMGSAFNDLSSVKTGINDILYGSGSGDLVSHYGPDALAAAQTAAASYQTALSSYQQNFALYGGISRTSSSADIATTLSKTADSVAKMGQATKDTLVLLGLVQNYVDEHNSIAPPPALATQTTSALSYASKMSADNTSVVSALTALQNATASLGNTPDGTPIPVQSAQLSLTKAQNALQDARDNLADYYLYAPFDGTVAKLSATVGAQASTLVATMITAEESAVLSLDEVDAAAIKLDQKATLTFDAIPDLTLTGTVTGVDTIGTVSQGVVSYSVTITFDSLDARVKPGMTVSAAVITQTAVDALTVPSSAVKTVNGTSVVQVFDPPLATSGGTGTVSSVPPKSVPVTTGISDDTDTQILSGLTAGEQVVVRSSTAAATVKTSTTPAAAGGAARGGAGNAVFRAL
jgi:RND family efflux transporter MFP subunit